MRLFDLLISYSYLFYLRTVGGFTQVVKPLLELQVSPGFDPSVSEKEIQSLLHSSSCLVTCLPPNEYARQH